MWSGVLPSASKTLGLAPLSSSAFTSVRFPLVAALASGDSTGMTLFALAASCGFCAGVFSGALLHAPRNSASAPATSSDTPGAALPTRKVLNSGLKDGRVGIIVALVAYRGRYRFQHGQSNQRCL